MLTLASNGETTVSPSLTIDAPPGKRCITCHHPQRQAIEAALASGESKTVVARRHGLNVNTMLRHWHAHARPLLQKALQSVERREGMTLAERVLAVVKQLEAFASSAVASDDRSAYLQTADRLLKALELQGKASGEIGSASVNVTVHQHIRDAETMPPEEVALRAQQFLRRYNLTYPAAPLYVTPPIEAEVLTSSPLPPVGE